MTATDDIAEDLRLLEGMVARARGQIEKGLEALSGELGQNGRRRHAVSAYGKTPG